MESNFDPLRNLRIFHIGNIANNAYNAAAKERELGFNSFAISPNYKHLMGFPFWETEELHAEHDKHFDPEDFINERNIPEWFLWGTWEKIAVDIHRTLGISHTPPIRGKRRLIWLYTKLIEIGLSKFRHILKWLLPSIVRHWLANSFLHRARKHEAVDLRVIFNLADILVFYGPYNAYTHTSNFQGAFASMEHGTLRDWINSGFELANDSKTAYLNSRAVMITNQDCFEPALRLGIPTDKLVKTPHPSSDSDMKNLRIKRIRLLSQETPINILCPARHSKPSRVDVGKGNEIAIEALVKIASEFSGLKVQFVEWGDDIASSKRLISKMKLDDRVEWLPVMSRKALKARMSESLAVVDQFKIEGYGAIMADAMGLGVPVISKQNIELDIRFFGTPAPILKASSAEEIVRQVRHLVQRGNLSEIFSENIAWYEEYLSSDVALMRRIEVYRILHK